MDRSAPILAQCESILGEVTDSEIVFHVAKIGDSIAAFRGGQPSEAQALSTNVLDSTLQDFPTLTHRDYLLGRMTAPGGLARAAYVEDLPYVEAFASLPSSKPTRSMSG